MQNKYLVIFHILNLYFLGPGLKCSEPCLGTHTVLRNPRLQGIMTSSGASGGPPPPTPTSPIPPPLDKLSVPPDQRKGVAAASNGGGMSRSISDTTLRRAALHLNLSQSSVLPSFTSLQQFKVVSRPTR